MLALLCFRPPSALPPCASAASRSASASTPASTPRPSIAPLGRRGGGREGQAALRTERRPAVHPGQQHQARGDAVASALLAARLDRAHQPLRRRAGRGRRPPGRPRPLRPRRPDVRPALLRDGHHCAPGACDTDAVRPAARAGGRPQGHAASASSQGDIVGDGSYFEPQLVHPGWEPYDLNWWYAAPVSGLGFNDNSVDFTWEPGARRRRARRRSPCRPTSGTSCSRTAPSRSPPAATPTSATASSAMPGTLPGLGRRHRGAGPAAAAPIVRDAGPQPVRRRALRQVLDEAGIAVTGTTRSTTDSLLYRRPRAARAARRVTSRPFRDWIFPILNTSQNWFAEMLLKQLGRQFGQGGRGTRGSRSSAGS